MSATLTLIGRQWCHLCDDMVDLLLSMAVSANVCIDVRDVDEDELLLERWDEKVPVLLDGKGRELCHYHLDVPVVYAYLGRFPIESVD